MTDASSDGADVTVCYEETADERRLRYERDGRAAVVAQNAVGYGMVAVRAGDEGPEIERYYALDAALEHVGDLLGTSGDSLPVPESARDMGI